MALKITFELNDEELRQLRRLMREAREKARARPERVLTAGARSLLAEVAKSRAPQFVRERLARFGSLLTMLEDKEWGMTGRDRERVVGARRKELYARMRRRRQRQRTHRRSAGRSPLSLW